MQLLQTNSQRAIVLLSGGLDSATVLAIIHRAGWQCYALTIDYEQRHKVELKAAIRLAKMFGVIEHKIMRIDLRQIGGSALTDDNLAVPTTLSSGIPITYVPARNIIFLSLALSWAEVLNVQIIAIGVNAVDYSDYPDCRPEFINTFEQLANLGTKAGSTGNKFSIYTPLLHLSKAEIIKRGLDLGLDYSLTVSCYQADSAGRTCGVCDACRLRAKGFAAAGITDVSRYM